MAPVTFELVIRDVIPVDELRRVFCLEYFRLIMAFHATVWWYPSVSLDHIQMTLTTGDAPFNVSLVIKGIPLNLYVPFGLGMARCAGAHGACETILKCVGIFLTVEMANETIRLGHG
jgi:hypothetical protein